MNFVFTSAGNITNFDTLWLGNNQSYDMYVIYYDNDDKIYEKYKNNKYIKHIEKRNGSKFQNFYYFYNTYPEIINKYERFFILDDDIIFNVDDINTMFRLSREYKLEICGPSFKNTRETKIASPITIQKKNVILTYTNFVEVNTMLFSKNALDNLMKYMIPELIGWGIDILAIWANGLNKSNSYAIVHSVSCINPKDDAKGNKRELYKIKNATSREETYNKYIEKLGVYDILKVGKYKVVEYGSIKNNSNKDILTNSGTYLLSKKLFRNTQVLFM